MAIYTKKGDKGTTSTLRGKEKISKSSCQTQSLGAIDELNSFLGIVISLSENKETVLLLDLIQNNLLTIGSILGGSSLRISKRETLKLEKQIDNWDKMLPKLSNFIYPGGSTVASLLQYARTLTRKAERETVGLSQEVKVAPQILTYLNRLSDYLFTLARVENHSKRIEDKIWKTKL